MSETSHKPQYDLNIWERALGWRKRQMIIKQLDPVTNQIRNNTLEEVAKEFDGMKNGGDTTASFAVYVRSMKK
jgi:hypothetical protein